MRIAGLVLCLLMALPLSLAEEGGEVMVFELELEKLLNLGSGLLALVLSSLTIMSYRRSRNKRLLYVSLAFMLFSAKSFLVGAEIVLGEWPWVDQAASILDFAILSSFFMGIMKR